MKNNALKRITATVIIICIVNLIVSAVFICTLPDIVPVHFNFSLVCDRVGSKWTGLIVPAISAVVFPLCMLGEKKTGNAEKNSKPLTIILAFINILLTAICWFMLLLMKSGAEIGEKIDTDFQFILLLILGLMFTVIGNYLPTVRQNKTLGIKVPWTLKNERCWDVTHRFSGKLYVFIGIIMIAAAFVLNICNVKSPVLSIIITVSVPAISAIIPTIYAYNHRND